MDTTFQLPAADAELYKDIVNLFRTENMLHANGSTTVGKSDESAGGYIVLTPCFYSSVEEYYKQFGVTGKWPPAALVSFAEAERSVQLKCDSDTLLFYNMTVVLPAPTREIRVDAIAKLQDVGGLYMRDLVVAFMTEPAPPEAAFVSPPRLALQFRVYSIRYGPPGREQKRVHSCSDPDSGALVLSTRPSVSDPVEPPRRSRLRRAVAQIVTPVAAVGYDIVRFALGLPIGLSGTEPEIAEEGARKRGKRHRGGEDVKHPQGVNANDSDSESDEDKFSRDADGIRRARATSRPIEKRRKRGEHADE